MDSRINSRSVSPSEGAAPAHPINEPGSAQQPIAQQHSAQPRHRLAHSLFTQGQRSPSPHGVSQGQFPASEPAAGQALSTPSSYTTQGLLRLHDGALFNGAIDVPALGSPAPLTLVAPHVSVDRPFREDYHFLTVDGAERVRRETLRRAYAQDEEEDEGQISPIGPVPTAPSPEDVAVDRWAPVERRAQATIEAHEFVLNLLPAHLCGLFEQERVAPLRTLLAALPFSVAGADITTARRVFEQARELMLHLAHPTAENLLNSCIGIAANALDANDIEGGFARIRQRVIAQTNPRSSLARLESQPPMAPVGLVHLQSRFGNRRANSMHSHIPGPGDHSAGYVYISLSPSQVADMREAALQRAQQRALVITPSSPFFGAEPLWTPADTALNRWGQRLSPAAALDVCIVADEFAMNTVPVELWRELGKSPEGKSLLTLLAALPLTLEPGDSGQQHTLFCEARQTSEALLRAGRDFDQSFYRCLEIAGQSMVGLDDVLDAFKQIRQTMIDGGMPSEALVMHNFSGEQFLFDSSSFTAMWRAPASLEDRWDGAVDQAIELWSPGAPEVRAGDVQQFLSQVMPENFWPTLSALENSDEFLALFAGLRMTAQRLNPVTLHQTTEQARQALADLQRFNDPHLLSLCTGIASEVACADSLQHCFTQIRTALVNHAASLGDGQPGSVFAAIRPSFNQDVVEKMAIEFSNALGRLPQEAIEYYVQLVSEVAKQVQLVESVSTHTWGNLGLYRIAGQELDMAAEQIVGRIREKTTPADAHFLDFFATHPAWQKVLTGPLYGDEHKKVVAERDRISDEFSELSIEEQAAPATLARMKDAENAEGEWFKAKSAPLLADLVSALAGEL